MPAGQSLPPHSVTSVWRRSGGLRRLEKDRVVMEDVGSGAEGMRSSEMVINGSSLVEKSVEESGSIGNT